MRFQRFHGPAAILLGVFTLIGASTGVARADDHEAVASHGIEMQWAGGTGTAESFYAELAEPVVSLRLVNHDRVGYTVLARTLEDAGSLQTRRTGSTVTATLAAGGTQNLAIRFGGAGLSGLTHSGMVTVVVQACPSQGPCIGGASYPLFFHASGGRVLVYGEGVLCQQFRCGDLAGTTAAEPGTWRVLGGGPLHNVTTDEEIVTGGAQ
ncbi:MAG TPA: hypothetical protein VKK31_03130 [Thermoanaerobaculia bacterium]|nr:hypothetical protein [Thermoanaerobaculia bacterium]